MNEDYQQNYVYNSRPSPQKSKSSGFAVAGFVCGLVGIATAFIPVINFSSYILGLLAVIFGIVALAKKQSVGFSVSALLLGVVSVIMVIVMSFAFVSTVSDAAEEASKSLNNLTGDNTDELLKNTVNVKFGTLTVHNDSFYKTVDLEVTVKNISNERHSFSLEIEAVDNSGNRIAEDVIMVSDLGAGQSVTEKTFTLVSQDKIDQLKTAKFRVMTASMY